MQTLFSQRELKSCQVQAPKQPKQPKVYDLNDVLLFGKYQRQMLRAVAIQDPEYLLYMQATYKLSFTDQLVEFIKWMKFYSK